MILRYCSLLRRYCLGNLAINKEGYEQNFYHTRYNVQSEHELDGGLFSGARMTFLRRKFLAGGVLDLWGAYRLSYESMLGDIFVGQKNSSLSLDEKFRPIKIKVFLVKVHVNLGKEVLYDYLLM